MPADPWLFIIGYVVGGIAGQLSHKHPLYALAVGFAGSALARLVFQALSHAG